MGKVVFIAFVFLVWLGQTLKLGTGGHGRLSQVNWSSEQFTQFINRTHPSSTSQKSDTANSSKPDTFPYRTKTPPQSYSQEHIDPYQKMFKWAQLDPALNSSLDQDHELTPQQQKLVVQYMVNDAYFQQELVGQLKQNEQNSWIKELPPRAQIRYLKTIAQLTEEDVKDKRKVNKVEEKLLDDYDIEPVYRNFVENHPTTTPIQEACMILTNNSM